MSNTEQRRVDDVLEILVCCERSPRGIELLNEVIEGVKQSETELAALRGEVEARSSDYLGMVEAYEKCDSECRQLRGEVSNLLAVIHRDGGQYQSQHGDCKATVDAQTIIIQLREELAELRARIVEMSDLCLTNGEVDKIKADAIREAVEAYFCSGSMSADDLKVFMRNYADKVERGI